jgi:hypothetical protein
VDASGSSYEQDYDDSSLLLNEGDLVRVTYTDGKAAVSKYELGSKNSLGSCVFNSAGTIMGDVKLSSNIKILDTYDGQYIKVFPERLAGTDVSSYILYYELNSKGELTQLILNNVTGDMYKYGIFTGVTEIQGGAAYGYLINGISGSLSIESAAAFEKETGPQRFTMEGEKPVSSVKLSGSTVLSVGNTSVQVKDTKLPFAEDYDVYFYQNGKYMMTTIDKVSNTSINYLSYIKYDLSKPNCNYYKIYNPIQLSVPIIPSIL